MDGIPMELRPRAYLFLHDMRDKIQRLPLEGWRLSLISSEPDGEPRVKLEVDRGDLGVETWQLPLPSEEDFRRSLNVDPDLPCDEGVVNFWAALLAF